jgi:hypothetical protein
MQSKYRIRVGNLQEKIYLEKKILFWWKIETVWYWTNSTLIEFNKEGKLAYARKVLNLKNHEEIYYE